MHFHDLRHTHETWLVEDQVPRVLRLQRLGHKREDTDDFYSHVTPAMGERCSTGCSNDGNAAVARAWLNRSKRPRRGVNTADRTGVQEAVLPARQKPHR